jgi:protein-disulfide isomerase
MKKTNIKEYKEFFIPGSILLAALFIGGSILYTGGVISGGSVSERRAVTIDQPSGAVDNNGSEVTFVIEEGDHVRGNLQADITLVEFSDFECPFCSRFHPTAQQALTEYGNDIRWVYKHFPLDSIHPQARPASEASECVWEQKGDAGFWEFADAMFENQGLLSSSYYVAVATDIGVNVSQFENCVSQRTYQDKVEQQYQQGLQAGVAGTPGSFVNGIPVRGAVPYEQLQSIIESQL